MPSVYSILNRSGFLNRDHSSNPKGGLLNIPVLHALSMREEVNQHSHVGPVARVQSPNIYQDIAQGIQSSARPRWDKRGSVVVFNNHRSRLHRLTKGRTGNHSGIDPSV